METQNPSKTIQRISESRERQLANLKRFGIDKPPANPTSEQKKAGWERKKERQRIADKIASAKLIPLEKARIAYQLLKDAKNRELTEIENNALCNILGVEQVLLEDYHYFMYAFENRYMVDWIDRNVEKAPNKVKLSGDEEEPNIKVDYEPSAEYLEFLKKLNQKNETTFN